MVFSSLSFILRFMPVFFIIYYLTPVKWRNVVLFGGSVVFYAFGEPKYVFLILSSVVVNYFAARWIARAGDRIVKRRLRLAVGIVFDLSLLIFFKYAGFLAEVINGLAGTSIPVLEIALPLGISFYTFQIMSYLIDVARGRCNPDRSIIDLGAYIMMFPQLIAGPIVVYDKVALSLKARRIGFGNLERGLKTFILGLGSKVLLANKLGALWSEAGFGGFENMTTVSAWVGITAYTLQIYFDFNGYSLMAIGLGEMLGFRFPRNFNFPYIASSVSDFWKRWHITLTSWFREYVYIPLGGNRKGVLRTYLNLLIIWFITGLWHGAGWNFILWGLYYFVLIALERSFTGKILEKSYVLSRVSTLLFVMCGWVLFASPDLTQALIYLKKMFVYEPGPLFTDAFLEIGVYFGAGILFSTPIFSSWYRKHKDRLSGILVLLVIFWACVVNLVDSAYNPFLYFRF